ncbi:hypothetical protein ACH4ND_32885 [Streptomyces sp. NPDC017179]|uniref:hypothetical protein n=1 Tax=Streptomyces sp. NPDC017179 TaxID=3364979 RepID=UPI0037AEDBC5
MRAALPDAHSAKSVALDALSALGSQFVLILVLVIVGVCFLPSGHHGGFTDWLSTATLIAGLALRGTLTFSVAGSSDSGSFGFGDFGGSGDLGITVQPILLTCTALLAVWWFARRREALSPAATTARIVGRSATAALAYAVAMSLLVATAHTNSGYGLEVTDGLPVSFDLGIDVWPMLPYAFLLVFLADCAARSRSRLRQAVQRASAGWAEWWGPAVTAASASAGLLAAAFLGSLVYVVVGNTGDLGFGTSLAIALFSAPNVAILLGGGLMGATLGNSIDGDASAQVGWMGSSAPAVHQSKDVSLLHGGLPATAYLLLLATALVFLPFALRHALGRDPQERTWKAVRIGVVMAPLWGLLALLATVSASMSGSLHLSLLIPAVGSSQVDLSSGLREPSSILVALAWGTLIAVAARFLARPLAGAFPRVAARLTRLPGQAVHPQWAALLADSLTRSGRSIPAFLVPSLTEPLTSRPLSVNPRRTRRITTAIGVVVMLGAGAVATEALVASKVYGPQNAAENYLRALSEGHAADALAHLQDPPSAGPLLSDDALGVQLKAAPLHDIKVTHVERGDHYATVSVSYLVGDDTQTADLSMVADSEHKHFGLWPRWKVSDGLGHVEVTVPPSLDSVRVNGKQVAATDGTTGALTVFPGGVITSAAAGSSLLKVDGGSLLTVEPGAEATSADLTLHVTAAGEQAVRQAVRDALTSCMSTATTLDPEGCPMSAHADSGETVSDIRWSLVSEPEVNVRVDDETGYVTVDGSFETEITYRTTDTDDTSDAGDTTEEKTSPIFTFTFTGSADFAKGTPTISFDD